MQAYVVGGAVRDELLGLPVVDRDWVVVGATPEEMTASGYRPVGRDFPVFLHPDTHEEYALARTERKSGRGYRGFTVYSAADVTLEDDLKRRDLTVNAMARDAEGRLTDPFGGERDLKARVLRHVSESFIEDPVRILRVARFAARFGFAVAEETMQLMQGMVENGEVDHLVPERVWQELSRGLCEPNPVEMFAVLEKCSALARIAPELNALIAGSGRRAVLEALQRGAQAGASLQVRFAALAWFVGDADADGGEAQMRAFCDRLRAPLEVRDLAVLVCRCRAGLRVAAHGRAEELHALLKHADAFRRPERFEDLLSACGIADPATASGAQHARAALSAATAVDAGAIARDASAPGEIAARIDAARLAAIRTAPGCGDGQA